MVDMRITLAAIWGALMLTYLLGDVLRIFSGDYLEALRSNPISKPMWLGIAVIMVIPILMILVSLMVTQPVNRWINIIAAVFFFIFNLIGLPTYPSAYDKFLIVVGLVMNVLTVWNAWNWA